MNGWRVLPLQRSLGPHAAAWDELNTGTFGNHPLLASRFVDGLLRNFGTGTERLCMLEEGGQIQAMCILQPRNRLTWASFLPSQAQVGMSMVPDAALLPSLLSSLPLAVLQLDLMCNDPDVGAVLGTILPYSRRANHALTMKIDLQGSFDGYWASRARGLPSNIKRYGKRLEAAGIVQRFERHTEPDQVAAAIDRYAKLEGAGWKGTQGTALGSRPEQYRFYRDLMLQAAASGEAIVYELWFDQQLAASRLVLCEGRTHVMLKTGYDETLKAYSPGRLLLKMVVESAFTHEQGGTLEFYTDADVNLLEWATGQRWIQHLTLFRHPAASVLNDVAHALLRPTPAADGLQVERHGHPAALPADARQFLHEAERRSSELGYDWYLNLVDTVYGDEGNLHFYVLRDAHSVLAVMPLQARKLRLGWALSGLSNFYTGLYEPSIRASVRPHQLLVLLSALERDFPGLSSLQLTPMDPVSHAYVTVLGAMRLAGWVSFEYFSFGNWHLPVRGNWQTYLAGRSGEMKSTIKRMSRKFASDGGTLELVAGADQLERAIGAYQQVYAASWKKAEPFPEFMPGLIRIFAGKGSLRLGLAWMDGQAVAAQLWIVAHGRAEIYKLAYHEQFKAYSPGTLITALLMEHVIETDRVREVDYLIGDDPYKKTWMSDRRERWGIIAYNARSIRGVVALSRETLGRSVKYVQKKLGWRQPGPPPPADKAA